MAKIIVEGGNLVWDGTTGRGGHIMFILQWLEGLKRLGHEVLYYDKACDRPEATTLFADTMERWWNPTLSAAVLPSGKATYGLNASEVERFGRDAAAIISFSCTFGAEPEPWLADVRPRVLIDTDPGFNHVWASKGNPDDIFGRHDFYFTVGANVGTSRCSVPTFGIEWQPIWNPVVLDWWCPSRPITRDRFTTVASWWDNAYQEFEGKIWGPKAEQIRRFVTLPQILGEQIEIALDTAPNDQEVPHLESHGWVIKSPKAVVASPGSYRDYLSGSTGEFSCAKGLYVGTKCGWFSDRSSCYLAAGRPVVVQGTGFSDVLPTGEGLFSVDTVDEAANAIRMIRRDYRRHATAARNLARQYFDSHRLLSRLLEHIGVN